MPRTVYCQYLKREAPGLERVPYPGELGKRIYENISARFHLGDWHRTIDDKLQTLDDLYQLLNHDQTNRWMLILELTIVLLFVIDLLALIFGFKLH